MTIIEYLQRHRVLEAQKMPAAPASSIAGVCYGCGFNNIAFWGNSFLELC